MSKLRKIKGICSACKKIESDDLPVYFKSRAERFRQSTSAYINASCRGHHKCIEAFIAAGADVNENDDTGLTPLLGACKKGQTKCVDILIAAGV